MSFYSIYYLNITFTTLKPVNDLKNQAKYYEDDWVNIASLFKNG